MGMSDKEFSGNCIFTETFAPDPREIHMKEMQLPPRAAALSESMRDLGYSIEAAVADIIDNSISAEASRVDIFSDILDSGSCLAILDNGKGMDEKKLVDAMRHGSKRDRKSVV